jgi:hypothetical protein
VGELETLRDDLLQRARASVLSGTSWLRLDRLSTHPEIVQEWLAEHRIFVLDHEGVPLVPAYALFDGTPVRALQAILKLMAGRTSFQVAAWLESPTAYLDGRRPRELLATDGQAVMEAASTPWGPFTAKEGLQNPVHAGG